MKNCTSCKELLSIDSFNKNRCRPDGREGECRECRKSKYRMNVDKHRLYHLNNKERNNANSRRYYEENKERIYNQKKNNKELKKKVSEYYSNRRKSDPAYRLKHTIKCVVSKSMSKNGHRKTSKTSSIIGCEFDELKIHLELQFEDWMNWDNYGKYNGEYDYGWDIDHIIPLSTAETEEDVIRLNHFTNLRPLCSNVNRYVKRDKTDYEV